MEDRAWGICGVSPAFWAFPDFSMGFETGEGSYALSAVCTHSTSEKERVLLACLHNIFPDALFFGKSDCDNWTDRRLFAVLRAHIIEKSITTQ